MLLIGCPWCGPRNEDEFHYGGQAGVAYPEDPGALTDAQWAQYLFFRDNPKGAVPERWSHSAGCRRWFTITRDTATNAVLPDAPAAGGDPAGFAVAVDRPAGEPATGPRAGAAVGESR